MELKKIMAKRILVVEDESIVGLHLESALKRLGYDVLEIASTGEEAIMKTQELHPELILMDIVLKGEMDGIEAASQIRAKFDVPIIYLTAYGDESTLQRAKITEPFGYIIKPFEERELHNAIEIALYKHEMDKKMRHMERMLSTTLRSIGDGVISIDMHGHVTFMNPAAETLTGWKQEDAKDKTLKEIFNIKEFSMKDLRESLKSATKEGLVFELISDSSVLVAKDGTEIAVADSFAPIRDESGNVPGAVIVFRDVSERAKATRALRDSEHRFRILFENAPLSYQSLDANGCFIDVNKEWLDSLGYSREEVLGHWFGDFMTPQSAELVKKNFPILLATGEIHGMEYEMKRKDGSTIITSFDGRTGHDEQGNFKQTHCIFTNITERKKHEEELSKLNKELEKRVKERTAELEKKNEELEHFNRVFVGRELRMVELKKIISELEIKIADLECGRYKNNETK